MVSEAIQPIISELPISEKRKLLGWLLEEVKEPIKPINKTLENRLKTIVTKARQKNESL